MPIVEVEPSKIAEPPRNSTSDNNNNRGVDGEEVVVVPLESIVPLQLEAAPQPPPPPPPPPKLEALPEQSCLEEDFCCGCCRCCLFCCPRCDGLAEPKDCIRYTICALCCCFMPIWLCGIDV